MNVPYVKIKATCSKHGQFLLQRKPNRTIPTAGNPSVFYQAVTCPRCRLWMKIDDQVLVTDERVVSPTTQMDMDLEG